MSVLVAFPESETDDDMQKKRIAVRYRGASSTQTGFVDIGWQKLSNAVSQFCRKLIQHLAELAGKVALAPGGPPERRSA